MTPIKYTINYAFKGTMLRLRVLWNHGSVLILSVGYHVDREKWDGKRCIKNTTHGAKKIPAAKINHVIESLEERISDAFAHFERIDTMPSKPDLSKKIRNNQDSDTSNLFAAFDDFMRDGRSNRFWSPNTWRRINAVKTLLQQYNPGLRFSDLTKDGLKDFINYQTGTAVASYTKKSGGYQNSTIAKNYKILTWFLRWAAENGHNPPPDFATFRPTLRDIQNPIVFLTWDELMKVYSHDFSASPTLDAVRDAFCLCCFTSMRYSDLRNVKKANITDSAIVLTTKKTSDTITIDLNKYSRAILSKYADSDGPQAIPVLSNQKMNDNLKKMGAACGIDTPCVVTTLSGNKRIEKTLPKYELLTTHCGRRTFICNALALGIPPNIVMKWTGHKNYESMLPYIAVHDKVRQDSMKIFDQKEN